MNKWAHSEGTFFLKWQNIVRYNKNITKRKREMLCPRHKTHYRRFLARLDCSTFVI